MGRFVNSATGLVRAALVAALAAVAGCVPGSFLITPVPESRTLAEHVVYREGFWAARKIALIEVDGMLSNSRSSSLLGGATDNPVALFADKLRKAASDNDVAAIVLRINSPGGGVTASDLMYEELQRFKRQTKKPIVAAMLDIAASGGYYIACAADRIFATPTSVTGSIGVIMLTPDVSGAMSKLGIKANVIKSGEMKDVGSPFRAMAEKDRAVFQEMVDAMYERFLDVVAAARPGIPRETLRGLADGRVYLGAKAKTLGLVDEIGPFDAAIAEAKRLAGVQGDIVVVQYAPAYAHRPNYYAESPAPGTAGSAINVSVNLDWQRLSPEFLYLWTGP
jgi:protease IV